MLKVLLLCICNTTVSFSSVIWRCRRIEYSNDKPLVSCGVTRYPDARSAQLYHVTSKLQSASNVNSHCTSTASWSANNTDTYTNQTSHPAASQAIRPDTSAQHQPSDKVQSAAAVTVTAVLTQSATGTACNTHS